LFVINPFFVFSSTMIAHQAVGSVTVPTSSGVGEAAPLAALAAEAGAVLFEPDEEPPQDAARMSATAANMMPASLVSSVLLRCLAHHARTKRSRKAPFVLTRILLPICQCSAMGG
jgi:hypothetical protein